MEGSDDAVPVVVRGRDLNDTHTLVGDAGGRSAVYDARESSLLPGLWEVHTEHGNLYLDPDADYLIET